jgi:tetratricopeptide (TPR) repeat protein
MSGLVLIGPHASADRYAYIPLLGIFVILCWGAADLIDRWRVPLAVAAVCAAVVLTALGLSLRRQVSFWNDNVALWNHTLQVTGANFTAEENLALALIDQGKIGEALPHLYRAQSLQPHDPLSTLNIATYDQMRGNYEAALAGFTKVIQFPYTAHPMRAVAFANSGYAHLSLHKYTSAKQDFESALHENANNSAAYRGMGLLAQRSGDLTEAVRNYELAVELQPSSVGYLLLAHARELGLQPEAGRAAESQAIRLTRDINDEIAVARQLLRDCCSNDQP